MAPFPLSYFPNVIKPWTAGEGQRWACRIGEFKVIRTSAGLSSLLKYLQVSPAAQEKIAGECKKPSHPTGRGQLCRILRLISSQWGQSVSIRGASVWVRPWQNVHLLWIKPLLKMSIWSNASLRAVCFYARNGGLAFLPENGRQGGSRCPSAILLTAEVILNH